MTIEEIVKLRIGDVIYNKETGTVVEIDSEWIDRHEFKENESLSSHKFYSEGYVTVRMSDYEQWEFVNDEMPDTIKLKVLTEKFFRLEAFVYQRLR